MQAVYSTIRYALTGVAVAVTVDALADFAGGIVISTFDNAIPPTTTAAKTGRDIFQLTVGVGMAAVGVLAGENMLSRLNPGIDDPLYRWFFYQTAFYSSSLARRSVTSLQGLVRSIMAQFTRIGSPTALQKPKPGHLDYTGTGPVKQPIYGSGPVMGSPDHMKYGSGPVMGSPDHMKYGSGPVISPPDHMKYGSGPVMDPPTGTGPVKEPIYGHGPVISQGPPTAAIAAAKPCCSN